MTAPTVSVCMATYNGLAFLQEQLDSILVDIGEHDEVVVYDDASTDGTAELLSAQRDPRIRILLNERNVGHVRAFGGAMRAARGDVIALADQDDVWVPGRTTVLLSALENADLAVGNYETFGAREGVEPHALRGQPPETGSIRNLGMLAIGRLPYFGSTMMMQRALVDVILPIPDWIEAHDQWIGILGNIAGRTAHVPDIVTRRRIHTRNQTPNRRRSMPKVAYSRWLMVRMAAEGVRRCAARHRA